MTTTSYDVTEIPASEIRAADNDRQTFDPDGLRDLAASIERDGLGQPPTVRPIGDGFELVCGERRTRAMRDVLGWDTIPVIVRELDDDSASALMLAENTARLDLDPLEEARAYRKRLDAGASVSEVARTAGRSEATVRARLALLKLSDETLHLVTSGSLALGHAVMMAGLDVNRQNMAVRAYDADRLHAPAFGALCDRLMMEQEQEGIFDPDTFMRAEEYAEEAKEAARKRDPRAELEALRARVRELEGKADTLLGVQEIAELLGVQVRTVHQWQHRDRLPEAEATVSGLPAWRRTTVVGWARETGRL